MLISSNVKTTLAALVLGVMISTSAVAMQGFFRHRQGRAQMGNRNQPITVPAGARQLQNVSYGSDPLQKMDVYIPANAHNAPVIFMVHGGGWRRGDKTAHGVVQNKVDYFLPKGYVFISTNYRLVPQVNVMDEADDVAHALAYAQQHASEWGADPSRFIVMGHSAGAHLVVLMSSVPSIWQGAGAKPWLGTVALDSGAYNVVDIMNKQHFGLYDTAFGSDPKLWQAASPTLRLQTAPPPMLLVCDSDRKNDCDGAQAYADKAKSLGGKAAVYPVGMRHGEINLDVGTGGALTDRITDFLHSVGLN
ncbi:MAG TPA: alpha/beta hydrolase [Rhodanobacteraceae bacterium]|jgi:arylformamidase|nr:alpha/beta hydrolase [Rhodanobacteraceae bacterium]